MDTTPQNIEMCRKAREIQGLWHKQLTTGDFTDNGIVVRLQEFYPDETWELELDDDHIKLDSRDLTWLPRQDQLQEMLKNKPVYSGCYGLCIGIYRFANNPNMGWGEFNSMEQLWLAFVMKEKFNKTWSGSDWV